MKFLLLVVVLVAATTAAQAQDQGGKPSIDTDRDGYITKEEMTKVPLPITVTDDCWKAMLERADTNGDNRMTVKEFEDATSTGGMPKGCSAKADGAGGGQVGEPAPGGGGGASSVIATFSLMFLLAATTTFFSL